MRDYNLHFSANFVTKNFLSENYFSLRRLMNPRLQNICLRRRDLLIKKTGKRSAGLMWLEKIVTLNFDERRCFGFRSTSYSMMKRRHSFSRKIYCLMF